jgi:hypothetical protein
MTRMRLNDEQLERLDRASFAALLMFAVAAVFGAGFMVGRADWGPPVPEPPASRRPHAPWPTPGTN